MSQTFLENVADNICAKQSNIEDVLIVVPNRRSVIYLDKILSQKLSLALLPEIVTMQQLIENASAYYIADSLLLCTKLHKVFTNALNSEENLDNFYNWGEMLLKDFDEIDKNLAPAETLFSTLLSSKEIDKRFSFLTEEEISLIKRFWHTYKNPYSDEQEAFLTTWQQLYKIYRQFKQQLQKENLAYSGMVFREIAEKPEQLHSAFSFEKIAFVGFNMLNNAEKAIFQYYKTNGEAIYYWQADELYISNKQHEAGYGLRDHLKIFPSEIPVSNTLSTKKINVEIVAVSNVSNEAREIVRSLDKATQTTTRALPTTGIILPDENLLQPLLAEFSPDRSVNISMGFPFTQTAIFELLLMLKDAINTLHIDKHTTYLPTKTLEQLQSNLINSILLEQSKNQEHSNIDDKKETQKDNTLPYFTSIDKSNLSAAIKTILYSKDALVHNLQKLIFSLIEQLQPQVSDKSCSTAIEIEFEAARRFYPIIKQFREVLHFANLQPHTAFKIIIKKTRYIILPFEGFPLSGIQVLGLFEARNLDFKTIIIPTLNEGVFPKKYKQYSFIPYHIKKAFGLPTDMQQNAKYAYGFYRLLSSCENAVLIYNNNNQDGGGEMSRYLMQLLYEDFKNFSVKTTQRQPYIQIQNRNTGEYKPSEQAQKALSQYFSASSNGGQRALSPTQLNTFLDCKRKFYFTYLENIKFPESPELHLEAKDFGNILHQVLENWHISLMPKNKKSTILTKENILAFEKKLDNTVEAAINAHLKIENTTLKGSHLLVKKAIVSYCKNILEEDKKHAPFTIKMPEEDQTWSVMLDNGKYIKLKGRIDRVDRINDQTRIIDYKTGHADNYALSIKNIEALFEFEKYNRKKDILQILLYSYIYNKKNNCDVKPGLIYVQLFATNHKPDIKIDRSSVEKFSDVETEFLSFLKNVLSALNKPMESVPATKEERICEYCDFKTLCNRV